ncbi:CYTH and CHAD domain-containing protein [Nocardia sp. NPDC050710]|uniref:CYTH and CHAD domain-containing protein n=1 Tax=Nocardia sp. NPDC050710 TaxID=3157220 RepID=UPI0033CA1AB5
MKDELERESKWEVDQVFTLPMLDDFVPDSRVEKTSVELTSTYFDTAEHDLLSHNVTLRRREGEDESGWQLKIPHPRGRLELLAPLSKDLPHDLTDIVTGVCLGKKLRAVTRIDTQRNRHRVLGSDGELIVEVDDDTVRAIPADEPADVLAWREVEIELGPHTNKVPTALVDSLAEAGAQSAHYPSKLSRALPERSEPAVGESAAEGAIRTYLRTQIDAIFTGDVELRRGRDPIHDTRVAARRLRSTLRVYGKLLDPRAVGDTENELTWFAGLLGEVRDCYVQRRRLADRLGKLPPELVLGPVAARIDATLLERQLPSRNALAEAMNTPRYLKLLATLQAWQSEPPFGPRIRRRELVTRADKAARKADLRLATALADQRAESLHRARKAAKRARYAAELHKPVRKSGRAKSNIAYYKKLQRVLGDYHDGMVSAEFLWRTATSAGTTVGENGFTFGLLYADEKYAADRAREKVAEIAAAR